jgi:F-type H+-transporting ATPase subunit epsilon
MAGEQSLRLKVLTPERVVLEETVEAVYAVSPDGQFGILPRHIPMVRPLSVGILSFVRKGQKEVASLVGGILSTDGQTVTILTEASELSADIDAVRAEQARQRAEARLQQRTEAVDLHRAEMALARALARLKAAGKA